MLTNGLVYSTRPFEIQQHEHTHKPCFKYTKNLHKHTNEQLLSTKQQQTAVRKVTATLNANGNATLQYATKYANQFANNQDAPPDAKS